MRKEIPIAFSTEMVGAVVAGRKTMTRRVVNTTKNGWDAQDMDFVQGRCIPESDITEEYKKLANRLIGFHAFFVEKGNPVQLGTICPYGMEGDLMWVREEHQIWQKGEYWMCKFRDGWVMVKSVSEVSEETTAKLLERKTLGEWQRARFLPKEFARIWLERTGTIVERLQGISEEDILNEGVLIPVSKNHTPLFVLSMNNSAFSFLPEGCLDDGAKKLTNKQILFSFFAELWCEINGRESWDADPWVWGIGFKVMSKTGRKGIVEENCLN